MLAGELAECYVPACIHYSALWECCLTFIVCQMRAQVKLCDARSGAFTHNLTGHRQAVWAAAWSPSSQWHLATGGCDGQASIMQLCVPMHCHLPHCGSHTLPFTTLQSIRCCQLQLTCRSLDDDRRVAALMQVRMWDIRRAGCIALVDQHASQRSAALPANPMVDEWCARCCASDQVIECQLKCTYHNKPNTLFPETM